MSFTKYFLPNKYRTLFYRSDISSLVASYDLVHIHNPIPAIEMRNIAKACIAPQNPLRDYDPWICGSHGNHESVRFESLGSDGWTMDDSKAFGICYPKRNEDLLLGSPGSRLASPFRRLARRQTRCDP